MMLAPSAASLRRLRSSRMRGPPLRAAADDTPPPRLRAPGARAPRTALAAGEQHASSAGSSGAGSELLAGSSRPLVGVRGGSVVAESTVADSAACATLASTVTAWKLLLAWARSGASPSPACPIGLAFKGAPSSIGSPRPRHIMMPLMLACKLSRWGGRGPDSAPSEALAAKGCCAAPLPPVRGWRPHVGMHDLQSVRGGYTTAFSPAWRDTQAGLGTNASWTEPETAGPLILYAATAPAWD